MTIILRLFAILRERAGTSELQLNLPERATVETARAEMVAACPALVDLAPRVAFAVNRSYAPLSAELHEGDELAAIPPVSGG